MSPWSRLPGLRPSLVEGMFYAMMVGLGEIYFVAAAVRVGATPLELGLVVGMPLAAGGFGSLLSLVLLGRYRRRKLVISVAVPIQIVSLVALASFAFLGTLTAWRTILCACVYQAGGMASGTSWSSWFGDLVPEAMRGRFFAARNTRVHASTCVSLVLGGLVLQGLEAPLVDATSSNRLPGFALVFGLAAVARVISLVFLSSTPEPRFVGLGGPVKVLRFIRTERGGVAWRLLTTGAVLQSVTYLASPFFAPFMLRELHFSYLEYMIATLVVVVAKVLVLPRWGTLLDEVGSRKCYALAAMLVAVVPLPWLWAQGLGWVLVAQLMSGAAWAGYEVSFFTVLLDSSFRRTRAQVFAAQNVLNGTAQFLGGTLGGVALALFGGDFRWLFGISLVLRIVVASAIPTLIPRLGVERRTRRRLALRIVGFRFHGGLVHRLIDPSVDDTGEEAGAEDAEEIDDAYRSGGRSAGTDRGHLSAGER